MEGFVLIYQYCEVIALSISVYFYLSSGVLIIKIVAQYFMSYFSGFGVFTTQSFGKGEFILQYVGAVLSYKQGLSMERKYAKVGNDRWFLYLVQQKPESSSFW